MEINSAYQFFFHPLSEQHSLPVKVLSVITVIALSILTAGVYCIVFVAIHFKDKWSVTKEDPKDACAHISSIIHNFHSQPAGFIGIKELKKKQAEHLVKLQKLASEDAWEHLREHTLHPDSGFDWWMFPINRSSASYGDKYKLEQKDIIALKADPEFMDHYREGVKLVLLSWGWDASSDCLVENDKQRWTHYQIRLNKMLLSLSLFDEKELLVSAKKFSNVKGITIR
jgi:hypothetical protein